MAEGTKVAEAYVELGATLDLLRKDMQKASQIVAAGGEMMAKKAMMVAGTVGAAFAGFKSASWIIKQAQDSKVAMDALELAVVANGGAAGITAGEISDIAAALQGVTNYAVSATQSAAAVLLRFKAINGANFRAAIPAIADMASALGMDLSGAAGLVGKALNDPVKGVMLLGKQGVAFSESQKQMIESLVETGRTAEAQKVILGELQSKFAGQALAHANPFVMLGNAVGDLGEAVGNLALPLLTKFTGLLTYGVTVAASWIQSFSAVGSAISSYVGAALAYLSPLFGRIAAFVRDVVVPEFMRLGEAVVNVLANIGGAIASAVSQWGPVIVGIYTDYVAPVLGWIWEAFQTTLDMIGMLTYDLVATWDVASLQLQLYASQIADGFWLMYAEIADAFDTIKAYTIGSMEFVWQYMVGFFNGLVESSANLGLRVANVFIGMKNMVVGVIRTAFDAVMSLIGGISFALGGAFTGLTQKLATFQTKADEIMASSKKFKVDEGAGEAFARGFNKNAKRDYMDLVAGNLGQDQKRNPVGDRTRSLRERRDEAADRLGAGWEEMKNSRKEEMTRAFGLPGGDQTNPMKSIIDKLKGDVPAKLSEAKDDVAGKVEDKKKEPKSEFIDVAEFAKKLQQGLTSDRDKDKIARDQLKTLEAISKKLDKDDAMASLAEDVVAG